jgi:hypothetical protein
MGTYQLDAENAIVQVSGFIKEESTYMDAIKEYVLNTQCVLPSVSLNALADSKVPLHYFTPLFLTRQCV